MFPLRVYDLGTDPGTIATKLQGSVNGFTIDTTLVRYLNVKVEGFDHTKNEFSADRVPTTFQMKVAKADDGITLLASFKSAMGREAQRVERETKAHVEKKDELEEQTELNALQADKQKNLVDQVRILQLEIADTTKQIREAKGEFDGVNTMAQHFLKSAANQYWQLKPDYFKALHTHVYDMFLDLPPYKTVDEVCTKDWKLASSEPSITSTPTRSLRRRLQMQQPLSVGDGIRAPGDAGKRAALMGSTEQMASQTTQKKTVHAETEAEMAQQQQKRECLVVYLRNQTDVKGAFEEYQKTTANVSRRVPRVRGARRLCGVVGGKGVYRYSIRRQSYIGRKVCDSHTSAVTVLRCIMACCFLRLSIWQWTTLMGRRIWQKKRRRSRP